MKRHSYSERDYAFAQLMLTLRTTIGLTQAGLGERLDISHTSGLTNAQQAALRALGAVGEGDEQSPSPDQAAQL